MRARAFVAFGLAGLVVVLAGGACRAPTEAEIVLTSSDACGAMKNVGIVTGARPDDTHAKYESRFFSATATTCDAPPRIGTLYLTPGPEGTAGVVVAASYVGDPVACVDHPEDCVIARRTFGFVDHVALTIPIDLSPDCRGVPCGATTTCLHGSCVPSTIDCHDDGSCTLPGTLPDGGVDPDAAVQPDGAPIVDSGPGDGATIDGGGSDGGGPDGGPGDGGLDAGFDGGTVDASPGGTIKCTASMMTGCGLNPGCSGGTPYCCDVGGILSCTSMCAGTIYCCGTGNCPMGKSCGALMPAGGAIGGNTCQ